MRKTADHSVEKAVRHVTLRESCAFVGVACVATIVICSIHAQDKPFAASSVGLRTSATAGPFSEAELPIEQRFSFEGSVEERIEAGNYVYQRIGGVWVVSLLLTTPPRAERVRVTALGRKTQFHSKLLDRRFDVLVFGMVGSSSNRAGVPVNQ
jgi:hypothetical protein